MTAGPLSLSAATMKQPNVRCASSAFDSIHIIDPAALTHLEMLYDGVNGTSYVADYHHLRVCVKVPKVSGPLSISAELRLAFLLLSTFTSLCRYSCVVILFRTKGWVS